MTEFEKNLLEHLKGQAEQLTALSVSQSMTTQILTTISKQQVAILEALQKEPSSESLEATLKAALQPLQSNLNQLAESSNNLIGISNTLSAQLPAPRKQ